MISSALSNRLVFIFSLLGLGVASFLFYEYQFSSSVYCFTGTGCDAVRNSLYSSFFGISIPFLGIVFYFTVAIFALLRSHGAYDKIFFKLQLWSSVVAVAFGTYLTVLEIFVIKAICFWCVLSFIISLVILLLIILGRKISYENGN